MNYEISLGDNQSGTIEVINVLGKVLITKPLIGGFNQIVLPTNELADGIYVYRSMANGLVIDSGKITIEK